MRGPEQTFHPSRLLINKKASNVNTESYTTSLNIKDMNNNHFL